MNKSYENFLDVWHEIMFVLLGAMPILGLIIIIAYNIRLASLKDYKAKFDFASVYERWFYFAAVSAMGAALFFLFNTYKPETVEKMPAWFFIRLFIAISIATIVIYVANLLFKYYFPGVLNKKLRKYRYTARINPKTGNKMKLLSEEEEDTYLDEGMQAEENVFSVDYDVWIDPHTNDVHIEKYPGRLLAYKCDRCGFQTLKLEEEEIIKEATDEEDGEIFKQYKCSFCNRIKRRTRKVKKGKPQEHLAVEKFKFLENPINSAGIRTELVRIEIHSNTGDIDTYDFQTTDEAKKFLDEFSFDREISAESEEEEPKI